MTSHDQDPFKHPMHHRARAKFESAVDSLDAGTINRLRLMRREALASTQPYARRAWLVPSVAMAAAVLAVGLAWRQPEPLVAHGADVVTAGDSVALEFPSEDDAELYAWLGDAPVATSGGESL